MTAGRISDKWMANAKLNEAHGSHVCDWFAEQGNFADVDIDAVGAVWVDGPGVGRWLKQDEIDAICVAIDGTHATTDSHAPMTLR